MDSRKCPKCDCLNEQGRVKCSRCGAALPQVSPHPRARHPQMNHIQFRRGQIVAGRYSVLNMIGQGGMGCIYHVRDNALHEEVALKTLLPQFVRDKMVVERFFNEARIARALSHLNIVRVHDIGVTGEIIYISMELIRGKSLRSMLEHSITDDHIPFKQALRITDEVCAALEYAHRHTVHRDIKPENVMVCDDGTVKLMDFGISKLMDSSRLTGTSIIMGTPMYMSPEQLRNSASVDARADIYSIGVMLYEILTGNLPTSLAKPASQITRGIPAAIDAVVAKCVEHDPEKRFQSVTELRAALEPYTGIASAGSSGARRKKTSANPYMPQRQADIGGVARRIIGIVLIIVVLGLTAAGFYTLEVTRRHRLQIAIAAAEASPAEMTPSQVFERLAGLRDGLRSRLEQLAEADESHVGLLDHADRAWEYAAAAANDDAVAALEPARVALNAYMGPLIVPPGMVFVPPGDALVAGSNVAVEGFFMDTTEVTVGKYRRFCAAENWKTPHRYDLSVVQQDFPILAVTFYDAMAYAAWAEKSLPTEPQWARAAHGKSADFYPWDSSLWNEGAANTMSDEDSQGLAAPVKSFELDKSWAGCHDMAGNVAEWTRSVWSGLPYNPDDGREDMAGITFGTQLTIRGGSFYDHGNLQTRAPYNFEAAVELLGFRCAKNMPATIEETRALAKKMLAKE